MKVIFPHEIDLESTTVAANSEAAWSSSTTYSLDDLVQLDSTHKVYKSLRGNNTNRNPPDHIEPLAETSTSTTSNVVETGSKTFTTQTGKGYSAGMIVQIAKTSTPNTINMTGEVTSYSTGHGTLVVSVYSVDGEGTHTDWTITSEDEIGFWEEVESTEQWKMFDEYANSYTSDTDSITVKLNITQVDYIALFGLMGNTVEITLWDVTETVEVWSTTVDLIYGSLLVAGMSDWYEYFFGEPTRREDAAVDIGLQIYEGVLEVTISTDVMGEEVRCGNVVIGRSYELGDTQFGVSAGIRDFSYRDTDDKGRTIVTPGYWAKKSSMTLYTPNYIVDSVYKKLVSLRGIPTAWIGNNSGYDQFEALNIFGIYGEFEVTVRGPSHSYCELSIEGLI